MSIRIRRAIARDIDSVLPLVKDFVTSFEISEPDYRKSFARILVNPGALVLVAEDKGTPVGYCLGFCHDTFYANGRVAWLEEIMVATSHRRRGIGESMMATFEEWAKTQGAVLSALATRRASTFYAAIGYQESATYFRKLL
jgi:GNAT superfamily N-acetyltransferase